ncbi:MAG: alpha-ribazole phosphatase [bacterium]
MDKIHYPGHKVLYENLQRFHNRSGSGSLVLILPNEEMIHIPVRQLFLIRHGAVGPKGGGRFYGSTDLSLSDEGARQADVVARKLASERIKGIFTSPLKRARETARPVALIHFLSFRVMEGLREVNFGLWEGLSFSEIQAQYPIECASWLADPWSFSFPGGESVSDFKSRVINSLEKVLRAEGDTVVLAHGGSIRVILSQAGGMPENEVFRFPLDHGGITVIELSAKGSKVKVINDTAHLH